MSEKGSTKKDEDMEVESRDEGESQTTHILKIFENAEITNDSLFKDAPNLVLAAILKEYEEKFETNKLSTRETPAQIRERVICIYYTAKIKQAKIDRKRTEKESNLKKPAATPNTTSTDEEKRKIKGKHKDEESRHDTRQEKLADCQETVHRDNSSLGKNSSESLNSEQAKQSPKMGGGDQEYQRQNLYQKKGKSTQELWQTDGSSRRHSSEKQFESKEPKTKYGSEQSRGASTSSASETLETEHLKCSRKLGEQENPGDEGSKGVNSRRSSSVNLKPIEDIVSEEEISRLSNRHLREILIKNKMYAQGVLEKKDLVHDVKRLWEKMKSENQEFGQPHQDQTCKICLSSNINCVLLECGHALTCVECGQRVKECPVCRCYVVRIVRIFQ